VEDDEDGDEENRKVPPNEAALMEMIAKHAALQGGADWQDVNLKKNAE